GSGDPLMQAPALRTVGFYEPASKMVRAVGIEPTLLAERDFESRASTNSTTPALGQAYSVVGKRRNEKYRNLKLCAWLRKILSSCSWLGPRLANIDCGGVDIIFQMTPVIFFDHLDTCAAVFGNLVNICAFQQSQADISMA